MKKRKPILSEVAPGELWIEFPIKTIDPRIQRYFEQLESRLSNWSKEQGFRLHTVYTYFAMSVRFNHFQIGNKVMKEYISSILSVLEFDRTEMIPMNERIKQIPVSYGGECGPDLTVVADRCGLTTKEVIQIHSEPLYFVYFLGFLPGFPYLGGLDARIHTPRRSVPRNQVTAGSIAIGGEQTGVYPVESPGGWHVIGKTDVKMMGPSNEPFVRPGDWVQFVPTS
ncbi:5-oxoprolinase subunit PxpB [Mangrovibacillus cuniculi]|uniref:5-oxoprolinase subunit PxpB n=1 Tax=Mangrovibacillus cuniculi TaxID=2593652 RepID=A0A7S8HGQ3_9BACI|nr:5-oxoprolinase subunit PxpB [Mangrovibacillus cuniculi]QPC47675.1 5-oxoprolinase subunit PxpB [Mangrovibacillus cuniculi]